MDANPRIGVVHRQEYYKGRAEDTYKVVSLSPSITVPAGTFTSTQLTNEWTPLEPGGLAEKYFARDVGMVREADVAGGQEELVLESVQGP
jgi:hypothetical protein